MELRPGLGARSTQDVDIVFRGRTTELLDALEEAFEHPYSGFEFRRKGKPENIRTPAAGAKLPGRVRLSVVV